MSMIPFESYILTNHFLRMVGEQEIQEPDKGTPIERLQHLKAEYVRRLREMQPDYSGLPDDLIPDAILLSINQTLSEALKTQNGYKTAPTNQSPSD